MQKKAGVTAGIAVVFAGLLLAAAIKLAPCCERRYAFPISLFFISALLLIWK